MTCALIRLAFKITWLFLSMASVSVFVCPRALIASYSSIILLKMYSKIHIRNFLESDNSYMYVWKLSSYRHTIILIHPCKEFENCSIGLTTVVIAQFHACECFIENQLFTLEILQWRFYGMNEYTTASYSYIHTVNHG